MLKNALKQEQGSPLPMSRVAMATKNKPRTTEKYDYGRNYGEMTPKSLSIQ